MIRIFTAQMEKLHSEEGQALVFVAMVGLVIFLFFAMTMNLAEVIHSKIKGQNVADATAMSGAVWQARALNLISAANRNLLEYWGLAITAFWGCTAALAVCEFLACGEVSANPIVCIACLVFSGAVCGMAIGSASGAQLTGRFQDAVLDVFDRNLIEPDLTEVTTDNYALQPATAHDVAGAYLSAYSSGPELLRAYSPGDLEDGEYVFERAGICEVLVMAARYANFLWHLWGEEAGLSDDQWNALVPVVQGWYADDAGVCHNQLVPGPELPSAMRVMLPLMLRTRRSDWSFQNVETLLPLTTATYKVQEPPPVLGKGSGPWDCTPGEGDTRFPCTTNRYYAFASAHAYSSSVSAFYHAQLAGVSTPFPIPCIPFVMDWEPRLFPIEPYPDGNESPYGGWVAYRDIADQVEADGVADDRDFLLNNVLMLGGRHFFLY